MSVVVRSRPDQLGIVAEDVDLTIQRWLGAGAGPFFRGLQIPYEGWWYRGREIDFEMSVAVGYLGDLQIEILCPVGKGESPYHEFVAAGREGLQHMCWKVDSLEDETRRAEVPILLRASFAGMNFAYLDNGSDPLVEMVERSPMVEAVYTALQAPSIGWDGSDPVRPIEAAWADAGLSLDVGPES